MDLSEKGSRREQLDKPEACLCGSQSLYFVTISLLPVFPCTEGPSDINRGTPFEMPSLRPHDLHLYVSMLSIGSTWWRGSWESAMEQSQSKAARAELVTGRGSVTVGRLRDVESGPLLAAHSARAA